MAEKYAKIVQSDKRGQIVIPKSIRKELDLKEGAAFWVYNIDGGIFLKKVDAPPDNEIKKKVKGV